MSMSLAALEILEEAQFPPAQARAITRVLEAEAARRSEELASRAGQLATKADLIQLESRLESRFDVKLEKIQAQLSINIESVKAECVRWTFLAMVGQVSLLAGLMYFMLQNLR